MGEERQAKRPKLGGQGLTLLSGEIPLHELVPGCLDRYNPALSYFAGRILVLKPYNGNTKIATITLVPKTTDTQQRHQIDVHFKSSLWAQKCSALFEVNQSVRLRAQGAEIRLLHSNTQNGWNKYCVDFKNDGVTFWIGDDETPHVFASGKTQLVSSKAGSFQSTVLHERLNTTNGREAPSSTGPVPSTSKAIPPPAIRNKKRGGKECNSLLDRGTFTVGTLTYRPLRLFADVKGGTIVVAISVRKVARSAGGSQDWSAALHLFDASQAQRVTANLFQDTEDKLPDAGTDGSIVILQDLSRSKKDVDRNQATGYKNRCAWAVLSVDDLLTGTVVPNSTAKFPHAKFGHEEIAYAAELALWWRNKVDKPAPSDISAAAPAKVDVVTKSRELAQRRHGGGAGRKLCEIKDMPPEHDFFDAVAEVVYFYKPSFGYTCQLYVTDYTSHDNLYDYHMDDNHKWKGPLGQRTLQISINGEANMDLCERLEKGHIVYLRNVRVKVNQFGLTEGDIYEDKMMPDKADLRILNASGGQFPEQMHALCERREVYWSQRRDEINHKPGNKSEEKAEGALSSVTCQFMEQDVVTIDLVLNNEWRAVYRLRGRIIDYRPNSLQDWVRYKCKECKEDIPWALAFCEDHPRAQTMTYFAFHLAIQDSFAKRDPKTIMVSVGSTDSHNVLPGLKPTHDIARGQLRPLTDRLDALLGKIPAAKRHQRKIMAHDLGDEFDFSVLKCLDTNNEWMVAFHGTSFCQ